MSIQREAALITQVGDTNTNQLAIIENPDVPDIIVSNLGKGNKGKQTRKDLFFG